MKLLLPLLLATSVLAQEPSVNAAAQDLPVQDAATRVGALLDVVTENFLREVPRAKHEEQALKAFLADLDPYSRYMNADDWSIFEDSLSGEYAGVGISMNLDDPNRLPEIRYIMIGSTAEAAGLRRGDQIVSIDGRDLAGIPFDQVISQIRGVPGSIVALTIRHVGESEAEVIRVERRTISTPSVRGVRRDAKGESDYLLVPKQGIGYLRVMNLADDTVPLLTKALESLKHLKMKGLILDLRGSSGGKLLAAVAAADLFLDGGRVVTVVSRDREEVYDATRGVMTSVPMVMLIDGETVSSSEILAGALTDHKRALAIGQRTYGKGRVQKMFPLGKGRGGIVLSTGTFQRPSGRTIDRNDALKPDEAGIAPDVGLEVLLGEEERKAWRAEIERLDGPFVLTAEEQKFNGPDRVLEAAVTFLGERLGSQ